MKIEKQIKVRTKIEIKEKNKMENKALIGMIIVLFTYALFSWALGRYINKKKEPRRSEFQNFLSGAWIIGAIIAFGLIMAWLG